MMAADTASAPAQPGPPKSYLDLYGLSKPPFGGSPDSTGYILFESHRRAFDLLISHVANSGGVIVLQGEEGVGKTEALRSAAAVAVEWGQTAALVPRPANGRTSFHQLVSILRDQLDRGSKTGSPAGSAQPGAADHFRQKQQPGAAERPGPPGPSAAGDTPRQQDRPVPLGPRANDTLVAEQMTAEDVVAKFLQPPRKSLLVDDVEVMSEECLRLLLSLARPSPANPNTPAIVLTRSMDGSADSTRGELFQLLSLARATIILPRLAPSEIQQYIERSLWIAGGTTRRLIAPDALKQVIARSAGSPGVTNRLMEAVLTAGFGRGDTMITAKTVAAATGPAAAPARQPTTVATPRVAPAIGPRAVPRRSPIGDKPRLAAPLAEAGPLPARFRMPGFSGTVARIMPFVAAGLLALGVSVFLYRGLADFSDRPSVLPPRPLLPTQPLGVPPPVTGPAQPPAANSQPTIPPAANTPVAATPQAGNPPATKPVETLSPALVAALMKRGDQSVSLGDIAAARLLYRRAAEADNAAAATALGKTYDPNYLTSGEQANPARAAEWYRRAVGLGDPRAGELLKRLDAK